MAQHIDERKDHVKQVTYLSNRNQYEIKNLLIEIIRTKILDEIREGKYYTIIMDSTPDIGHEDQLTSTLRYDTSVEMMLKLKKYS